ncbi:MAG: hypothetical protein ACXV2D_04925 [Halobacteriota archaeon]
MIKQVVVIVALITVLSLSVAGCTQRASNVGQSQVTNTETSPSPSGGISAAYLAVLTTNLRDGGYTMVQPFTKTVENGQTVYVGTAAKGGVTFDLTYYPASSSSGASNMQQQQINHYIALGYAESPASTSTLWIGLLSSNQGIGVELLDVNPVEGVLVFSGTTIPAPTLNPSPPQPPIPTPTPVPVSPTVITVVSPGQGTGMNNGVVYENSTTSITVQVTANGVPITVDGSTGTNNALEFFINGAPAYGTWNGNTLTYTASDIASHLTPGQSYTLTFDYMGTSQYAPSTLSTHFTVSGKA